MENLVIGWFIRFGTPVSILHDFGGGGGLCGLIDQILLLRSTFGCLDKTTAGYVTFSAGVVERQNGIVKGLEKLRNEIFREFSLEATIAHALFAKISKLDLNGLSTYHRNY